MSQHLRVALVADTYPPQRTSGAVQLRDLSREFVRQGHQLTVLLPEPDLRKPWQLETVDGVEVLRLRAPRIKDLGYLRRTIGEGLMPFLMRLHFKRSPLTGTRWDVVIWYSPSIFHGPLVQAIKRDSGCKGYLILRDLFPEWAADMGLMGRGLPYQFFKAVARYQYSVADVIGVQSPGNEGHFSDWKSHSHRKLEVLQNWLGQPAQAPCSIQISNTALAKRKVFVYAGNMGIAQGMDIILHLAERLHDRRDIGFLLVGRGSEAARLRAKAQAQQLDSVLFHDEIHPDEIPALYAQCSVGLVALDPRHKTHNVPGKFLTYMQSGLAVLANVNSGNDLAQMIRDADVGQVCETNSVDELVHLAEKLLAQLDEDKDLPGRCRKLFQDRFSVEQAVNQIVATVAK